MCTVVFCPILRSDSDPFVLTCFRVTVLMAAMQVYLFESKSSSSLVSRAALHQFDFCMMIAEELRQTYWSADFLFTLFSHARRKLVGIQQMTSNGHPTPETEPVADTTTLPADIYWNMTAGANPMWVDWSQLSNLGLETYFE